MRFLLIALVLAGSLQSERPVAFVGVNLVPMTEGSGVLPDRTVVIRGSRIVAVGGRDSVEIPPNALRINGASKFLMPGLADMHVHLEYFDDPATLSLFIANGVTTVRNMDGRPYILDWRKRIVEGQLIGPTIYTAGPILDGDPPVRFDNTVIRDRTEALLAVAVQRSAGYDFIKVYNNLSAEAYREIMASAAMNKMAVAGHVPRTIGLFNVLSSGQVAVEHLGDYADSLESEDSPFKNQRQWFKRFLGMSLDPMKMAAVAREQAMRGVWSVPTLVQADRELPPPDRFAKLINAHETRYISLEGRQTWETQTRRNIDRMDDTDWVAVKTGVANRMALVREMRKAGVRLLAGTDTPNPYVIPGFALHEELQLLVQAGLTVPEALAASTRDAARFMGEGDIWGTLETGRRADLLLLDANPLEDVANVRTIAGVMVRGRWFPRESTDELLDSLLKKGGAK